MKKKTGVIAAVVVIGLISFFMLSHDKGNDGGTVGGGMKDEIIYCQGNDITTMDINPVSYTHLTLPTNSRV